MTEGLRHFLLFAGSDIGDGGRWRESANLPEFLKARESGVVRVTITMPKDHSSSILSISPERPTCAYRIRSRKYHTHLNSILLHRHGNAHNKSCAAIHEYLKAPAVGSTSSIDTRQAQHEHIKYYRWVISKT